MIRFDNRGIEPTTLQNVSIRTSVFFVLLTIALSCPARAQEERPVQPRIGERALPETPQPQKRSMPVRSREAIPPRRLSLQERFVIYRHTITNADSVVGPAFGALVNQANNDPPEWGQGSFGYARRFGSGYGRMLATRTLRFGIAAVDHEDPLFHASNEHGVWRRVRYATIHYFWVESDGGASMPAFSRVGSVYGAAFISNAWYPASHATTGHALLRGTTALSAGVGWNVFREFLPDIKDALHGNR
jgi:hypothetical protein